ncbi:MAG: hypothetical protein ACRCU5_15320 [Rhizobiaceae bacterium]
MNISKLAIVLATGVLLQSCAREDMLRTDGMTLGAGDAMARNTALQVIDPWPEGVEDTDLVTPNTRSNDKVADGAAPVIKPPATAGNP